MNSFFSTFEFILRSAGRPTLLTQALSLPGLPMRTRSQNLIDSEHSLFQAEAGPADTLEELVDADFGRRIGKTSRTAVG